MLVSWRPSTRGLLKRVRQRTFSESNGMSKELSTTHLGKLAKVANAAAAMAETSAKNAVAKAIESGTALNEAKEKCVHGDWIEWLSNNWEHSVDTAQRFMKLATQQDSPKLDEAKSVRDALRIIADASSKAERTISQPNANTARARFLPEESTAKDDKSDNAVAVEGVAKRVKPKPTEEEPTPKPKVARADAKIKIASYEDDNGIAIPESQWHIWHESQKIFSYEFELKDLGDRIAMTAKVLKCKETKGVSEALAEAIGILKDCRPSILVDGKWQTAGGCARG